MTATLNDGTSEHSHVQPASNSRHVLGQIARGEVRADAAAAREIAARHQDAYGDVWDQLWADALGPTTRTDTTQRDHHA